MRITTRQGQPVAVQELRHEQFDTEAMDKFIERRGYERTGDWVPVRDALGRPREVYAAVTRYE